MADSTPRDLPPYDAEAIAFGRRRNHRAVLKRMDEIVALIRRYDLWDMGDGLGGPILDGLRARSERPAPSRFGFDDCADR